MKKVTITILCVFVLAGRLPAQGPSDRFGGLKAKIEALLNPRLKPDPLPEKAANPFQFTPPGSAVVAVTPSPTNPAPVETEPDNLTDDERILVYAVARLRITGLVQRGGISHLLINSATYKVADLIPVRGTGDTMYYIRVVRITEHEVTFGYNAVTLAAPLPN